MSFFDWFINKPRQPRAATAGQPVQPPRPAQSSAVVSPELPALSGPTGSEDRRLRRHARREQLYVAVREAMTRSGVLSAAYKFKVLSLDQIGNEFLVMVDLSMDFDGITGQLAAMEALVVKNAKARFGITVPTVYWRMDTATAVAPSHAAPPQAAATPPASHAAPGVPGAAPVDTGKAAGARRDPLEADEVAAFRQALLAASARAPAAVVENGVKIRRGIPSYTLLTGFEDTELPESSASPVLSKTQYGDLT